MRAFGAKIGMDLSPLEHAQGAIREHAQDVRADAGGVESVQSAQDAPGAVAETAGADLEDA